MRRTVRFAATLVAVGLVSAASSVQAQTVQYSTSGDFSNGVFGSAVCSSSGPGNESCIGSNWTLSYFSQTYSVPDGSVNGPFGYFTLSHPAGSEIDFGSGSLFTLTILQSSPTVNSGEFGTTSKSITGNLTKSGGSNLIWTPIPSTTVIDGVQYSLDKPSYTIAVGVPTTVQGTVVTPEPASMALLATGLVGIFGAARRKRFSSKA